MNLLRKYPLWSDEIVLFITKAKYEGDYKIWVEFSNSRSGIVDLQDDLWGSVFEPLLDKEKFKQFGVSNTLRTIVWDNDADFAPEHLYKKLIDSLSQPTL